MKILLKILITVVLALLLLTLYFAYQLREQPLGPEPDLAGRSILFEKYGDGVQLYWRTYTTENQYTDTYINDPLIPGGLSDVILTEDEILYFIVDRIDLELLSPFQVFSFKDNRLSELASFSKDDARQGRLIEISSTTREVTLSPYVFEEDFNKRYRAGDYIFSSHASFTPPQRNITIAGVTSSCETGSFVPIEIPCLFGSYTEDDLVELTGGKPNSGTYVDASALQYFSHIKLVHTFYSTHQLTLPLELALFGRTFERPGALRKFAPVLFSEDEQYVMFTIENIAKQDSPEKYDNYVLDLGTKRIMKVSEGDVPLLMQ